MNKSVYRYETRIKPQTGKKEFRWIKETDEEIIKEILAIDKEMEEELENL